MAYMVSGAFPILPGKVDRVKNFERELAPHRAEWNRLCGAAGGFSHFNVTLQQGPDGDLAIYSMVFDEPSNVRLKFTDSPYDTWFTSFMRDVHGIDLNVSESYPPSVFTWQR